VSDAATEALPRLTSHFPEPAGEAPPVAVAAAERLLEGWFQRPVILTSSGRAALALALEAYGFSRYRDRVRIPPYVSRCIVSAVTLFGQPVEVECPVSATLLYHRMGFPERRVPPGLVIEDAAHAFFASASTGARRWASDVAVFSIPKFIGTAGLGGGLAIADPELAARIRDRLDSAPPAPEGTRAWMRSIWVPSFQSGFGVEPASELLWLESVYELLFKLVTPDPEDLAGLPPSLEGLAAIGHRRLKRVRFYRDFLGQAAIPEAFWPREEELLPFSLPFFGTGDRQALEAVRAALAEQRIDARIYQLDVRRDAQAPDFQPCVVVPCHQDVAWGDFEEMCRTMAAVYRVQRLRQ
jgi:hypothetical protein